MEAARACVLISQGCEKKVFHAGNEREASIINSYSWHLPISLCLQAANPLETPQPKRVTQRIESLMKIYENSFAVPPSSSSLSSPNDIAEKGWQLGQVERETEIESFVIQK